MKGIKKLLKWIWNNKEWIFSGIGITVLSILFYMFTDNVKMSDGLNTSGAFKEVHGNIIENIFQNSTINNYSEEKDDNNQENIMSDDTERNQLAKKELVIDIDGEKIYPISIDIKDEKEVGDWVYFRYMLKETYGDDVVIYPALFRYQEDVYVAERVNNRACYSFEVVGDCVYYLDSTMGFQDHGELYVSRPDGKNERILDDELYDFQIVDEKYIYYTYRHDTVGVGLEGHALHRMNLDGSEIMVVAYEVSGIDIGTSHFNYKVENGWVDCGTFKMELGEPANGYEKIVFKDIGDNDWFYYVTNRLMKARKDGSERVELDGVDDYYYEIEKIEDGWIYYIKGGERYKIRTDGSGKEAITDSVLFENM